MAFLTNLGRQLTPQRTQRGPVNKTDKMVTPGQTTVAWEFLPAP
jgi:hypothetical protein